ncbi:hypothetical protein GCM10007935_12400 [Hydrogenophaga electricum]|uniref:Uncharacterized protein n=1 Tax=Hydrogenophaga electricum TaxID=1230953 RepID=A0ABQ6C4Z1_9BURK|nr:hypothetical protein GCM10007935_12400 [Hydrogenophaga electricum]
MACQGGGIGGLGVGAVEGDQQQGRQEPEGGAHGGGVESGSDVGGGKPHRRAAWRRAVTPPRQPDESGVTAHLKQSEKNRDGFDTPAAAGAGTMKAMFNTFPEGAPS